MKTFFKTDKKQGVRMRRLRVGIASLLLVPIFVVAADAGVRHTLGVTAKQIGSGRWREAANSYVTYFNFLFRPETGAAAKVDVQMD